MRVATSELRIRRPRQCVRVVNREEILCPERVPCHSVALLVATDALLDVYPLRSFKNVAQHVFKTDDVCVALRAEHDVNIEMRFLVVGDRFEERLSRVRITWRKTVADEYHHLRLPQRLFGQRPERTKRALSLGRFRLGRSWRCDANLFVRTEQRLVLSTLLEWQNDRAIGQLLRGASRHEPPVHASVELKDRWRLRDRPAGRILLCDDPYARGNRLDHAIVVERYDRRTALLSKNKIGPASIRSPSLRLDHPRLIQQTALGRDETSRGASQLLRLGQRRKLRKPAQLSVETPNPFKSQVGVAVPARNIQVVNEILGGLPNVFTELDGAPTRRYTTFREATTVVIQGIDGVDGRCHAIGVSQDQVLAGRLEHAQVLQRKQVVQHRPTKWNAEPRSQNPNNPRNFGHSAITITELLDSVLRLIRSSVMTKRSEYDMVSPLCIGPGNALAAVGAPWRWCRDTAHDLGVPLVGTKRRQLIPAGDFLAALKAAKVEAGAPLDIVYADPAAEIRRRLGLRRRFG